MHRAGASLAALALSSFGLFSLALALGLGFFGSRGELIAVLAAIALWRPGGGVWAAVLGFGIVFEGLNSSGYLDQPFIAYGGFVLGAEALWLVRRLARERDRAELSPALVHCIPLAALATWFVIRGLPAAPEMASVCRVDGPFSCLRDLVLANPWSPGHALRTALTWALGAGIMLAVASNEAARAWGVRGLVAGVVVALALPLVDLVARDHLDALCGTNAYCAPQLTVDRYLKGRWTSLFGSPAWFGQFLLLGTTVLVVGAVRARRCGAPVATAMWGAGALLALVEALLSGQRATWLALGPILILLGIEWLRTVRSDRPDAPRRSRWTRMGLVGVVALVGTAAIALVRFPFKWSMASPARLAILDAGPALMALAPWGGVGPGQFRVAQAEVWAARGLPASAVEETAHNTWLNIAVETGIIGGVLLALAALVALCAARSIESRFERRAALALLAALAIESLFQDLFHVRAIHHLLFAGMGVLAVEARAMDPAAPIRPSMRPSIRWPGMLGRGVLVLALLGLRPGAEVEGCYLRERGEDGRWYRWCAEDTRWSLEEQGGMVALRIEPVRTTGVHVEWAGESRWVPAERPHRWMVEFLPDPASESERVDVEIRATRSRFVRIGRHLSFAVDRAPLRHPLPVANVRGLHVAEVGTEATWRWTVDKATFWVAPEAGCASPVLVARAPRDPTGRHPSVAVDWVVVDGPRREESFRRDLPVSFPLVPDRLNRVYVHVRDPVRYTHTGDPRSFGLQLLRVDCEDEPPEDERQEADP